MFLVTGKDIEWRVLNERGYLRDPIVGDMVGDMKIEQLDGNWVKFEGVNNLWGCTTGPIKDGALYSFRFYETKFRFDNV